MTQNQRYIQKKSFQKYYYACLVNLTSDEHRLHIGWKSDGQRMCSGWAAVGQQLRIRCSIAGNRMTILMKSDGFLFDSQRLSNRCSTAAHPLFIHYSFDTHSLSIRYPFAVHPIFNNNMVAMGTASHIIAVAMGM